MKILITGGSGFIGTNLAQYYLEKGYDVLNLDLSAPKNINHLSGWKQVDILDERSLKEAITMFAPDYLVHLAARTDLKENNDITGYAANYKGTENLIMAIQGNTRLKRVIFASSMLVCKVGYIPKNYDDYAPSTIYGQSKVMMEKTIKESPILTTPWIIVRPTSIWGPWGGEPYANLFNFIERKRYFLIANRRNTKTCGYVGNTIWQVDKLLFQANDLLNGKTFYLGDKPPYDMSAWAQEIAMEFNNSKLREYPYGLFRLLAIIGDIILKVGAHFPMTSFRLKNMITDNIIQLDDLYIITGPPPHSRREGIKETLKFLRSGLK